MKDQLGSDESSLKIEDDHKIPLGFLFIKSFGKEDHGSGAE